jgi:hypothetical protein
MFKPENKSYTRVQNFIPVKNFYTRVENSTRTYKMFILYLHNSIAGCVQVKEERTFLTSPLGANFDPRSKVVPQG